MLLPHRKLNVISNGVFSYTVGIPTEEALVTTAISLAKAWKDSLFRFSATLF